MKIDKKDYEARAYWAWLKINIASVTLAYVGEWGAEIPSLFLAASLVIAIFWIGVQYK